MARFYKAICDCGYESKHEFGVGMTSFGFCKPFNLALCVKCNEVHVVRNANSVCNSCKSDLIIYDESQLIFNPQEIKLPPFFSEFLIREKSFQKLFSIESNSMPENGLRIFCPKCHKFCLSFHTTLTMD
jgi:Zn finger protein HypA/HybF involved in hydrogenase expression